MKIVPDTSVLVDGKLSELAEKGEIDGEVIIPEFVVDEIENQANKGLEIGHIGIEEIRQIRILGEEKGFEVVDMGDVVREEMEKRDIPAEKTGDWVNKQREEKGMDAIAQLTVPYIQEKESEKIVVTGMRGLKERKKFEKELDEKMEMIAVWASPEVRKMRREERMRDEDREGDGFKQRDLRELENGVGRLMALSNHMMINDGQDIGKLEEKIDEVLEA